MKLKLLFILLYITSSYSQEISFSKEDTSIENIISTLFEGSIDTKTLECVWRPNISEKLQFGESYNGMLYTIVDTTFFTQLNNKKQFIIATTTYRKDRNLKKETCHTCAPSLSIITLEYSPEKDKLLVLEFDKFVTQYGGWGEPQDVTIYSISDTSNIVQVNWGSTGQGYTEAGTSFFHNGNLILSILTHEDNEGTTENQSERYEYNTSIIPNIKNNTLTFNKTGTQRIQNGKIIKVNETSIYKFIENRLEKICK